MESPKLYLIILAFLWLNLKCNTTVLKKKKENNTFVDIYKQPPIVINLMTQIKFPNSHRIFTDILKSILALIIFKIREGLCRLFVTIISQLCNWVCMLNVCAFLIILFSILGDTDGPGSEFNGE